MHWILLCAISTTVVVATSENATEMQRWMRAVEEILASHSISVPLRAEFNPDYLAKRTRAAASRAQVARVRAMVATAMVECADTNVKLCAPPHVVDEAIVVVLDELKVLGFEAFQVLHANWCPMAKAGILIHVPGPAA